LAACLKMHAFFAFVRLMNRLSILPTNTPKILYETGMTGFSKTIRKIVKRAISPYRRVARFVDMRRYERTTYLRNCRGVIHIGANAGQERNFYDRFGLHVLWVEPIPTVFAELAANIKNFPKQKALQALVSIHDDEVVEFQISSNSGKSSSILPAAEHKDVFPDIVFENKLSLKSVTLGTLLQRNAISVSNFDALLLDTQGAELLILQGAAPLLSQFSYIQAEAANFEAYQGCPRVADIVAYVEPFGFTVDQSSIDGFDGGQRRYFDILFVNNRIGVS
jgi:FkbM family methyltransferase